MTTKYKLEDVLLSRIFLALNNPRHKEAETEGQAIDRLCRDEDVLPLAKDIVSNGLSPLERFALVPIGSDKGATTYFVAEGNRRVCAMKLLRDPDLAPTQFRKQFAKLSDEWLPIRSVSGVIFGSMAEVRPWLSRIHNGPQGGIGRRTWNSDQKQRFDGGSKNRAAQALLDYAVGEGLITEAQRSGKLTTAQRYLSNEVFREALGLEVDEAGVVNRTRPKADFDILATRFLLDLIDGTEVSSRKNKQDILAYARPLARTPGVSAARVPGEALVSNASKGSSSRARRRKAKSPAKPRHIQYEQEIADALKAFGNYKLERLYYSLCDIDLQEHTPFLCVGAWAFFETLTACAGRNDQVSFDSYLNKAKLSAYGLGEKTGDQRAAIGRFLHYGNTTKHHSVMATFNGDQLNNDMIAVKELVLKCIDEAASKV